MIMQDDIIDAIIITGTRVTWPMVTRVSIHNTGSGRSSRAAATT